MTDVDRGMKVYFQERVDEGCFEQRGATVVFRLRAGNEPSRVEFEEDEAVVWCTQEEAIGLGKALSTWVDEQEQSD